MREELLTALEHEAKSVGMLAESLERMLGHSVIHKTQASYITPCIGTLDMHMSVGLYDTVVRMIWSMNELNFSG